MDFPHWPLSFSTASFSEVAEAAWRRWDAIGQLHFKLRDSLQNLVPSMPSIRRSVTSPDFNEIFRDHRRNALGRSVFRWEGLSVISEGACTSAVCSCTFDDNHIGLADESRRRAQHPLLTHRRRSSPLEPSRARRCSPPRAPRRIQQLPRHTASASILSVRQAHHCCRLIRSDPSPGQRRPCGTADRSWLVVHLSVLHRRLLTHLVLLPPPQPNRLSGAPPRPSARALDPHHSSSIQPAQHPHPPSQDSERQPARSAQLSHQPLLLHSLQHRSRTSHGHHPLRLGLGIAWRRRSRQLQLSSATLLLLRRQRSPRYIQLLDRKPRQHRSESGTPQGPLPARIGAELGPIRGHQLPLVVCTGVVHASVRASCSRR